MNRLYQNLLHMASLIQELEFDEIQIMGQNENFTL